MKHPNPEEWLGYLDGEGSHEKRASLLGHLKQCAECSAEVDGWQRSVQKLERLGVADKSLFASKRQKRFKRSSLLKWGLAAAIVLFIGFLSGRLSVEQNALIEKRLQQELLQNFQKDLLAALGPDTVVDKPFQKQLRQGIQKIVDSKKTGPDSTANILQSIRGLEENQSRILTLIKNVQAQHLTDYVSLREDLETAVSMADKDLRKNDMRITHLANTVMFAK